MNHHDVSRDLRQPTADLRRAIPEVWDGFTALHRAAVATGSVDARLKECAALAIAVVKSCDGCIAHHARAAARRGATAEEVAEFIGVALLMDGGPASVYGPRAFEAFLEFQAELPENAVSPT